MESENHAMTASIVSSGGRESGGGSDRVGRELGSPLHKSDNSGYLGYLPSMLSSRFGTGQVLSETLYQIVKGPYTRRGLVEELAP